MDMDRKLLFVGDVLNRCYQLALHMGKYQISSLLPRGTYGMMLMMLLAMQRVTLNATDNLEQKRHSRTGI